MGITLEILEWADSATGDMVRRIPEEGSADIKMGAQLIVQQSQVAIFVRDGKCLDTLGPGRHVLSTLNLPILTNLLALPYGFRSPFRAAVYFLNRKVFTSCRWGTKNPVPFRDAELGVVRLRGYGIFAIRIEQPLLFLNTVVGARGSYEMPELEEFLRDLIVGRLNDFLGERLKSVLDLAANYDEIGAAMKIRLREDFRRYGLELVEFLVNSITPPDEVAQMIDQRSGMGVVTDLDRFVKYESGRAVGGMGGGSVAGGAMESGIGAGLGFAMAANLARAAAGTTGPDAPPAAPKALARRCARCQAEAADRARFCMACGTPLGQSTCAGCNASLPDAARFCPECGRGRDRGES